MSKFNMKCNKANCLEVFGQKICVTICKHVFCLKHGNEMRYQSKCIACGYLFNTSSDITEVDTNINENHKAMSLMGLRPEKIMDVANRAMNFYYLQVHQQLLDQQSEIHAIKNKVHKLETCCADILNKSKKERDALKASVETLRLELNVSDNEKAELIKRIASQKVKIKALESDLNRNVDKNKSKFVRTSTEYVTPPYSTSANSADLSGTFTINPVYNARDHAYVQMYDGGNLF